jgi:hypothetical protein
MTKKNPHEIAFHLISKDTLAHLSSEEKLAYILNEVKHGRILVLEAGLTPTEQTDLIQTTMREINHDSFIGIEIGGYEPEKTSFIHRMLGKPQRPRMTIIGPAHLLRLIKKDDTRIETAIIPTKGAG